MSNDDLTQVSLVKLNEAENWQTKYRLITDWGRLISAKPEIRITANLIRGCEAAVWLTHRCEAGRHQFLFDSESRVMNGLTALLLVLVNNKTSQELHNIDVRAALNNAGLNKHLTPSRANGFKLIIARIYQLADIEDKWSLGE